MKRLLKIAFIISLTSITILLSCKKELSCESCRNQNQPPTAAAGPDTVITLPTDSVLLDGSKSSDPDGKITEWLWTKIDGPAPFVIVNSSAEKTVVKNLAKGVYQFELKVADDGGLSARDTVQIMVDNPSINQPPVANAGPDQIINLPTNTVTLDGSKSSDPDNNIAAYGWTKIAGPASFTVVNGNAVQTQVTGLAKGVYQFELKVTDAGGLFSKDTVQVMVDETAVTTSCGDNRTEVQARLIPVGALSKPRWFMAVASAGNKILFAGGYSANEVNGTSRVDIYDIATNTWSTAELSKPGYNIIAIAAGNKIFFAGGGYGTYLPNGNNNPTGYSTVDIYDASTNTWSVTSLSESRGYMSAGVIGDKVFFAGGIDSRGDAVSKVDIYNITTNTWSIAALSVPRGGVSPVTLNNKIYFAGGFYYPPFPADTNFTVLSRIDIYDNATNSWSTSSLREPQSEMAGVAIGNKIFWAGGYAGINGNSTHPNLTCKVQVTDANTQNSSIDNLHFPSGVNAVRKENKIVYFKTQTVGDPKKFDIYDPISNTWSVGILPVNLEVPYVISVNNTIYVAGGFLNGYNSSLTNLSDKVYKLEF
jgi:hypothetical protein